MSSKSTSSASNGSGSTPVERMYFAWNEALSRNDAAALLALYAHLRRTSHDSHSGRSRQENGSEGN